MNSERDGTRPSFLAMLAMESMMCFLSDMMHTNRGTEPAERKNQQQHRERRGKRRRVHGEDEGMSLSSELFPVSSVRLPR
jgi:hypothetical protein